MITLVVIGLLGGLITSLSPCMLPVLADRARRGHVGSPAEADAEGGSRPDEQGPASALVVAGLVVSFSLATLFGSVVLSSLGPAAGHAARRRDRGAAAGRARLLVPKLGDLMERRSPGCSAVRCGPGSQGLGLGLALGLVYVPCAGPVLATIAVVGATHRVGIGAFVLTLSFAVGIAMPLLALALAGEQASRRIGVFRRRMREVRVGGGVLMIGGRRWRSGSTSPTAAAPRARLHQHPAERDREQRRRDEAAAQADPSPPRASR